MLLGAIDFECVRSNKLLVVDGLCPHGIPRLTEIVLSNGSSGGYDNREEGPVEGFAGLRMFSHLFGVFHF